MCTQEEAKRRAPGAASIIERSRVLLAESGDGFAASLVDRLEAIDHVGKRLEAGTEVAVASRLIWQGRLEPPPGFEPGGADPPLDLGVSGMLMGGRRVGLEIKSDRQDAMRRELDEITNRARPELARIFGEGLVWSISVDGSPVSRDEIGELRQATRLILEALGQQESQRAARPGESAQAHVQLPEGAPLGGRSIRLQGTPRSQFSFMMSWHRDGDGYGRVADRILKHAIKKHETAKGHPFVLEYVSLGVGSQFFTPERLAWAWEELRKCDAFPESCLGVIASNLREEASGLVWHVVGVIDERVEQPLEHECIPSLNPSVSAAQAWANLTEHVEEDERNKALLRKAAGESGFEHFDAFLEDVRTGSSSSPHARECVIRYELLCSCAGVAPVVPFYSRERSREFPCAEDARLYSSRVRPRRA